MKHRRSLAWGLSVSVATLAGCGGDDPATSTDTAASSTASSASASTASAASTGTGGTGGEGTGAGGGAGGLPEFVPTTDDEQIGADAGLLAGEQIVFNDWNPQPNVVRSMKPDGTGVQGVMHAYRIWSFGAAHDGKRLAFSTGDPKQKQHYGVSLGDAIQHSWLYDDATKAFTLLAHGNINDECHQFSADDATVYVCRRYDFTASSNEGYRIGRIDVASKAFTWLTEELQNELDLYPQPDAAETSMLYGRIVISGGQKRSIAKQTLPTGAPTDVVADAGSPVLSPDGSRMAFADWTTMGSVWIADLDGTNRVEVSSAGGTSVRFSPDGTRVVYLVWDDAKVCSHVEIAAVDGSDLGAPLRIRDCGQTKEFITDVAWIVH